jgi:hypothetical protein
MLIFILDLTSEHLIIILNRGRMLVEAFVHQAHDYLRSPPAQSAFSYFVNFHPPTHRKPHKFYNLFSVFAF